MTVKFLKVERDNIANKERKAKGKGKLTYDYHIIVDGVMRGMWRRDMLGVGFELARPDGGLIRIKKGSQSYSWHTEIKATKNQFEALTAEHLANGTIPTPERWAEIQDEEAFHELYREACAEDLVREHRVERAAPQMLAALRSAMFALSTIEATVEVAAARKRVRDAINAATVEPSAVELEQAAHRVPA